MYGMYKLNGLILKMYNIILAFVGLSKFLGLNCNTTELFVQSSLCLSFGSLCNIIIIPMNSFKTFLELDAIIRSY